jgi:hypothetical protein
MMLITATLSAQVGIGTVTPEPSSMLDVSSTTRDVSPRRPQTQKNAIVPADGLMVYDTTLKHFLITTPLPQDGVLYQVVQQIEQNLKIKSTDVHL